MNAKQRRLKRNLREAGSLREEVAALTASLGKLHEHYATELQNIETVARSASKLELERFRAISTSLGNKELELSTSQNQVRVLGEELRIAQEALTRVEAERDDARQEVGKLRQRLQKREDFTSQALLNRKAATLGGGSNR